MDDWEDDVEDGYADGDDFSESVTVACSECGQQVYEDAAMCPFCGCYVTADHAGSAKPPWVIVTAVLLLISLLAWIL